MAGKGLHKQNVESKSVVTVLSMFEVLKGVSQHVFVENCEN